MQLSIVIPAYNEKNRIKNVITKFSNFHQESELIVVCDGTDNTYEIVKQFSNENPRIRLLKFDVRLGKGGGITEGFKAVRGDIVGFVDADESVEPEDIKNMIDVLSNADGVIASRWMKESRILMKQPLLRRITSRIFNIFVKIIFGLDFKDTQCGAKFFKNRSIRAVLSDLKTKDFEFDVELLWKLKKKGYHIVEYPIKWKHSEGSSFSLTNAPKMLFSLLKVRLWN